MHIASYDESSLDLLKTVLYGFSFIYLVLSVQMVAPFAHMLKRGEGGSLFFLANVSV